MDHRTRIDLTMMSLELRLAARGPHELVGQRLGPERLNQIAEVLERMLHQHDEAQVGLHNVPANDGAERTQGADVVSLARRR